MILYPIKLKSLYSNLPITRAGQITQQIITRYLPKIPNLKQLLKKILPNYKIQVIYLAYIKAFIVIKKLKLKIIIFNI